MSTDKTTTNTSGGLRQPEFTNANSFSQAEKLLDTLNSYEKTSIFSEADTNLLQGLPEGFDDETITDDLLKAALDSIKLSSERSASCDSKEGSSSVSSTHWNTQSSVDLPPLRQPNLADVPPEVLGSLLKNENYGTFNPSLMEGQSSETNLKEKERTTAASGAGAVTETSGGDDAERTKTGVTPIDNKVLSPTNPSNPPDNVPVADKEPKKTNTKTLSPFAAEFVPRSQLGGGGAANAARGVEQITSKVSDLSVNHVVDQSAGYPSNPNNPYPDEDEIRFIDNLTPEMKSAFILETVDDALTHLKENPGDFDFIVRETIGMLHTYLGDPEDVNTLQLITTTITRESISAINFAYTGARLCSAFVKGGVEASGKSFKDILLNSCGQRFTGIIAEIKKSDNSSKELPAEVHGLTRFFGELYMNLKVEKNGIFENYNILGLAVVELLFYLSQTRKVEDVKILSQVLKLVGWQLEHGADASGKIKEFLNKIFSELAITKSSEPTTVAIIENLEKLRLRDWDYSLESSSGTGTATDQNPIYELPDEYDEDDWFDEEEYYAEQGVYLDDEPEDVQAAYEAFLAELNQ